jgi:hypothetical protein
LLSLAGSKEMIIESAAPIMKMLAEERLHRQVVRMVDHRFRRMGHLMAAVLPAIAQLTIFACRSRERHVKSSYVAKPLGRECQIRGREKLPPLRSAAIVYEQV